MRSLILLLAALGSCAAQDSIALPRLKRAAGRETVFVRLTDGDSAWGRLQSVDTNARTLTLQGSDLRRTLNCPAIQSIEFEPRSRRNKRGFTRSLIHALTLPLMIGLMYEVESYAVFAVWPGSYVWGGPVSDALVKKRTTTFRVRCQ
jgi:hypothetical protein